MAKIMQYNGSRPKATYFPKEDLYGYTNPIVYNETIKNIKMPVVNTDVSALDKNLHSEEALDAAAQSLGEDID